MKQNRITQNRGMRSGDKQLENATTNFLLGVHGVHRTRSDLTDA